LLADRGNPTRDQVYLVAQDAWSSIGMDIQIETTEWNTVLARYREGTYDARVGWWVIKPDPDLYDYFHTDGALNQIRYSNARVDELLELGRVQAPNSPESIATYQEVQRLLMADLPFAFINNSEEIGLVQDYVDGWSVHPYASVTYQDLHKVTKNQ
jgi:peptide/nickel transport system substrate-binding protein